MAEATALKAGTPIWIDLSTTDVRKAGEFYGAVLGWKTRELGPEAGGYVMFDTAEGKEAAAASPLAPGNPAPPAWTTYIKVDDAEATLAKAEANGAKVLMPILKVMDQGTMAIVQDPTGAVVALWQSGAHDGAQVFNAPGALVWNELQTRDVPAAGAFYQKVFGMEPRTEGEAGQEYTQFFVDGRSVAGMMDISKTLPPEVPANWLVYFGVSDISKAVAAVGEKGGQVRMGPTDSPFGPFAVIADPAGAVFAIIELKS